MVSPFKITDRRMRRTYHFTLMSSAVPAAVILAIGMANGWRVAPALWGALGIVAGAQLLLAGSYHLHTTDDRLSALGRRLEANLDLWFPSLLFAVQTVNVLTVLLVLWFSLQALGLDIPLGHNINILGIAVLTPVRMVLRSLGETRASARLGTAADLLGYPLTAFITLLVAGTLGSAFTTEAAASQQGVPTPLLVVWVPALLTVLVCAVLLVVRLYTALTGARKRPATHP
jgi:hypothetical protein